ncbi:MAG: T9SS type A sorting domain-containing protein [Bacteroidota bacterium]|nr:T9SS type A sorting domain-containing protein [Bacteroidota bacterium]
MKKLFAILFFIAVLFTNYAQAQCSVDTSLKSPGFKPDTIPHAMEQVSYSQVIQFKFPTDTTVFSQKVTFDSLTIKAIDSLPKSITWQCGKPGCTYLGGENGCLTLSGTPPTGTAGKYKMIITVTAHFPMPAPFPYRHQDFANTWNFYVDGANGILVREHTNYMNVSPNPFDQHVNLEIQNEKSEKSRVQIFDVHGRAVYDMNLQLNPGINQVNIDTKIWNSGLYIIKTNGAFAGKIIKM